MSDIAVIGSGGWGTAVANSLSKNHDSISLWSYEKDVATEINETHTNSRYLYGVWLDENIKAYTDLEIVINNAEYVFFVTPSFALDKILRDCKAFLKPDTILVFLSKGFHESDNIPILPLDLAGKVLGEAYADNSVYLSGASHAEEVSRNVYTGLIAASKNKKNAVKVRDCVATGHLSVYVSFDPVGVQISAAMKNIIAIAFGLADAMKEYDSNIGDNTFAMVISSGLNEIQALGRVMGATHPETFTSFSSVGDLFATCTSHHGRNRRFGRELLTRQLYRKWENFDDMISKIELIGYLPEGIFAVKHVKKLEEYYNIKLPIIDIVYAILNREILPREAVSMLMSAI